MKTTQTDWDLHDAVDHKPLEFTEESNIELFGIELSKAQSMVSGLSVTFAEREVLKDAYLDVINLEINAENLPTFKELRLKFVKNRTSIEKWHKENKAFYLAGGRFVDAIKNKEILFGQEMEAKLMDAEKFFERQQAEITEKLNAERISLVEPYLESVIGLDLTTMDAYIFDSFLEGAKAKFNAKIESERIAEEQRIAEAKAEAERLEAQRLENAILKAEAEAAAKKNKAERLEREKLAKIESDKIEARRVEQAKAQALKDAVTALKLKEASDARAKAEAELKAVKDAEIKAENKRAEKIASDKLEAEKLAKAPIKIQLTNWVENCNIGLPPVTNEKSIEISNKFQAFKKWAKLEIEKL